MDGQTDRIYTTRTLTPRATIFFAIFASSVVFGYYIFDQKRCLVFKMTFNSLSRLDTGKCYY